MMDWREIAYRIFFTLRYGHGIRGPIMVLDNEVRWFCGTAQTPPPHHNDNERTEAQ